jgi:hypothetical protein
LTLATLIEFEKIKIKKLKSVCSLVTNRFICTATRPMVIQTFFSPRKKCYAHLLGIGAVCP